MEAYNGEVQTHSPGISEGVNHETTFHPGQSVISQYLILTKSPVWGDKKWRTGSFDSIEAFMERLNTVFDNLEINYTQLFPAGVYLYASLKDDEIYEGVMRIHYSTQMSDLDVDIYAHDLATHKHLMDQFVDGFPEEIIDTDTGVVPLTFLMQGSGGGASSYYRTIKAPEWVDIQGNYPEKVRSQLDELMEHDNGDWINNGQLIMMQGNPGVGKTYVLRSLIREWKDWCKFKYVIDPENFFGHNANYLVSALFDQDDSGPLTTSSGKEVAKEDRWTVLIFEDTGELLARDAKNTVHQAFARLLNVVDGLIGQGLNILVLITTNEELKDLHPAIQRSGRCLAKLKFGNLSAEETDKWLEDHELELQGKSLSLADLYMTLGGDNFLVEDDTPALGFSFSKNGG